MRVRREGVMGVRGKPLSPFSLSPPLALAFLSE